MTVEEIKSLIAEIGTGPYRDGSSTARGHVYHPIPFPEFSDVPVHKSTAAVRDFEALRGVLGDPTDLRVLDLGAALGYYSFRLVQEGAGFVSAVEGDDRVYRVFHELVKLKYPDGRILPWNCYVDHHNIRELTLDRFDVCLMLNVHQWIYKQIGPLRTKAVLRQVASRCTKTFFQTAHRESRAMFRVEELKDRSDLERYLESCGFLSVRCINSTKEHGRIRYMFVCSGA